jgi:hypothetical protein
MSCRQANLGMVRLFRYIFTDARATGPPPRFVYLVRSDNIGVKTQRLARAI